MAKAELCAQTSVMLLYCRLQNCGYPLQGIVLVARLELVVELAVPLPLDPPRVVRVALVFDRVDCESEAFPEELLTEVWPCDEMYVYCVPVREDIGTLFKVLKDVE